MPNSPAREFFASLLVMAMLSVCPELVQAQPASGGKKPPAPAIPGLPELPPGVELPDDVKQELEKALKEVKALQDAAKAKQPTTPKPAPVPVAPSKSNPAPKSPAPKTPAPKSPPATKAPAAVTAPLPPS